MNRKRYDKHDYFGFYYLMGVAYGVRDVNGQLAAAMPGVPAGYEVVLEPIEADRFQMRGGPLDGGTVVFVRDETSEVTAMRAGSFELAKVPQETAKDLAVTERLLAPDLDLTPEKESALAALLQTLPNLVPELHRRASARAPKQRGKSSGRAKGTQPPHRQRHLVIKNIVKRAKRWPDCRKQVVKGLIDF